MSNVIIMPDPRLKKRPSAQHNGEATILLFLGVRYVRTPETEDDIELSPMPLESSLAQSQHELAASAP